MAGPSAADRRRQDADPAPDLRLQRQARRLGIDRPLLPVQQRRLCARPRGAGLAGGGRDRDRPGEAQAALLEGAEEDRRSGLLPAAVRVRPHLRLQQRPGVPAYPGRNGSLLHGALEVTGTWRGGYLSALATRPTWSNALPELGRAHV